MTHIYRHNCLSSNIALIHWPNSRRGNDPKMDEQGVFIHCTHKSRMAGGRWLGGLYDTFLTQELLFLDHSNMLGPISGT